MGNWVISARMEFLTVEVMRTPGNLLFSSFISQMTEQEPRGLKWLVQVSPQVSDWARAEASESRNCRLPVWSSSHYIRLHLSLPWSGIGPQPRSCPQVITSCNRCRSWDQLLPPDLCDPEVTFLVWQNGDKRNTDHKTLSWEFIEVPWVKITS